MKKTIFRNTLLILMGLVVLTITSCEKDSDGDTKANEIIGVWTISSSTFEGTINGVDIVQYFMDAFGVSQAVAESFTADFYEEITGTANFKADGTYTMTTNGSTDNGSYKLSADGKKLTLDEGTVDELIIDVATLTSSKMEFSFTETEVSDMDEDGTDDTLIMTISLVLTK